MDSPDKSTQQDLLRAYVESKMARMASASIDRRAFQVALRDTAKSLVGSEVEAEAGRLLDRVAGPGPGGKTANEGRAAIRGLLEGIGKEVQPKKR